MSHFSKVIRNCSGFMLLSFDLIPIHKYLIAGDCPTGEDKKPDSKTNKERCLEKSSEPPITENDKSKEKKASIEPEKHKNSSR